MLHQDTSANLEPRQSPVGRPLYIVRLPAVMARTGLARSTIYHMLGRGLFPRPIALGERAVGWLASEVDAWLLTRIETSRGPLDATTGK